ncbi:MAG: hypothetical protein IIV90_01935 [Oscillospiraceae bacterium]|nr:hypothetical protein [Oscillospiraceae bacterium]
MPTKAPTATPTKAPEKEEDDPVVILSEPPYISAYAATDAAGGELTKISRNDRFTMVLRVVDNALAAYGDVDESNVAARLNSSVFTYTGLAEVSQFSAGYSEGKPYCSYVLIFRDVLYNGGGNTFAVDISYEDTIRPVSAISQVLGICDQSEARTPGLIVRDVNYGGASIAAGQPATLTLSIFATSGTEDLNDVMVTLGLPEGVTLASGTQTLYLGSMNSNGLQTATFSLLPSATFTGGVANIGVGLSAVGRTSGAPVSGSSTVSIPVTQPERFEITGVETSDTMMLGDSSYISVTFVNKGKTNINNLSASITGDNLANPGQSQFLGNIAPGTENSVDFDIMAMDVGTISGQVVLSYEDDAGAAKTLTAEYSVMVEEMPVFEDPFMEDPMMGMPIEEEESGLPGWAIALIAVAVGGGAAVAVRKVLKNKKAKALAALGDEDEDL